MAKTSANGSIHLELMTDTREPSDEALLQEFLTALNPAAEEAFRALVDRYGPMVLGTCRQVLHQAEDAEDAFQATFLQLARKASTIRDRRVLAGWLHGVAFRAAIRLRSREARRRAVEERRAVLTPSNSPSDDASEPTVRDEVRRVLHEELGRLPEKYRVPMVLSYLEGRTNEEAAALLSCPVGTVKVRLVRARQLLRTRLNRRGVALSSALLLTLLRSGRVLGDSVPVGLVKRSVGRAMSWRLAGNVGDTVKRAVTGDAAVTAPADAENPARSALRRPRRWSRLAKIGLLFLVFFLAMAIGDSLATIAGGKGFGVLASLARILKFRQNVAAGNCQ